MRLVIGEDESLLRHGLTHVLEHAGHQVVATAGDAEELVRQVGAQAPDLVVTDIRMPPAHTDDGLRAALRIRREHPGMAVVVLSQHVRRRYAIDLVADNPAGVGYLLKQRIADIPTFCAQLEDVRAGGTVLDPEVVAVMVARAGREDDGVRGLTGRQQQVLALMAEGLSNAAIADRLTITEKSVVHHVSNIYVQLGLPANDTDHRRVLAVVRHLSR
jgi:DNA-binding NarL/FixJ family response regulator